jgi:hypothetical protein
MAIEAHMMDLVNGFKANSVQRCARARQGKRRRNLVVVDITTEEKAAIAAGGGDGGAGGNKKKIARIMKKENENASGDEKVQVIVPESSSEEDERVKAAENVPQSTKSRRSKSSGGSAGIQRCANKTCNVPENALDPKIKKGRHSTVTCAHHKCSKKNHFECARKSKGRFFCNSECKKMFNKSEADTYE